jgi:dTDP-4-amino-4,6-dideoxygalactose transaminase
MGDVFKGDFTQQEPIPDEAIAAALKVLRHGRLHRYNLQDGETGETALLEVEFAAHLGAKFCLAVASGGYALCTAMRAVGVGPGDRVLSNAFTLAPVPGAIASLGAAPVFVEVTEALTIDLVDLKQQIQASGARTLLLSHMRGHICDMDRLMEICTQAGVTVIEDCAHTLGASWRGVHSGLHGLVGCYSTQTYKHLNSGEGGLLVSDDAALMARATILSGSYMHYDRHRAAPPPLNLKPSNTTRPIFPDAWTICAPPSCARSCVPFRGNERRGMRVIARSRTVCATRPACTSSSARGPRGSWAHTSSSFCLGGRHKTCRKWSRDARRAGSR